MMSALAPLLALGLCVAALERVPGLRRHPLPFLRPYFPSDLVYLVTGFGAGGGLALAYVAWAGAALDALGIPRPAWTSLPTIAQIPLALLGLDLGNYLAHLLLHRVDALWELHKVHHSSRSLDWLATFRSHLLEQALRRALAPALLILLGAPLATVATASACFLAFATLNHANLRLPLRRLEPLLITPRLHRIHHVADRSECNLGTVLCVWDRLRGALVQDEPEPGAVLGVPGEVESYPQSWLPQLVLAPARALGLHRARGARSEAGEIA
jgi:sterol desaturase/sphingolipid hydroxylase (fatty acid hydroxylase superfamily)